ncbi:DsbA family protein [Paludifilum halophilum]|nr:thioredoxin domain-containing protein [Paludifilum halophilum]
MSKKKSHKNSKERVLQKQAEERSRRMKNLIVGTLIGLLFIVGIVALVQSFSGDRNAGEQGVDEEIFDYDQQPVAGDPDAPVKIVEFGDFKCPSCKKFEEEIYPQLKKDFIDNEKIGFYFVNNQFLGPDSITAGIAGEAVYEQDPDAFWKFYDSIYKNQGLESEAWATPDFLADLAKKDVPGIDHKKLKKDIENETYSEEVQADKGIAEKAGVTSVPTLFINGKKVPGEKTFDYDYLKQRIEEELNRKK